MQQPVWRRTSNIIAGVCLALLSNATLISTSSELAAQELIIKREPVSLINQSRYQIPLILEPTKAIDVSTPVDGTVQLVNIQPGQQLRSQTEMLRLDATRQNYVLSKAKSALKAAQLKVDLLANSDDAQSKSLASAELEVAKADLQVAEYDLQKAVIRAPIDGTVFRVLVQPGQFVKAGDPLIAMGNTDQLLVRIPVDRNTTKVGATLEIAIESAKTTGVVQNLLPLVKDQAPLRDLVESAATAELIIDNPQAKFSPGQTVYSPLVPRYPVMEVANAVLSNGTDGGRKVQVLRENVVTDIPVNVLGPVGPERSFVTGPFSGNDQLIVSSSVPLTNGVLVRAATQAPRPQAPAYVD